MKDEGPSDEELNRYITQAMLGEELPAQIALGAILIRIAEGRPITKVAAMALIRGVERTIKQGRAAEFFADKKPKRRGPRKKRTSLEEALTIAKAIDQGFNRASPDWDEHNRSAFAEAARQMGAADDEVEREAARLKKFWDRLGQESRKKR